MGRKQDINTTPGGKNHNSYRFMVGPLFALWCFNRHLFIVVKIIFDNYPNRSLLSCRIPCVLARLPESCLLLSFPSCWQHFHFERTKHQEMHPLSLPCQPVYSPAFNICISTMWSPSPDHRTQNPIYNIFISETWKQRDTTVRNIITSVSLIIVPGLLNSPLAVFCRSSHPWSTVPWSTSLNKPIIVSILSF